jgi:hypothetical protein
MGTTNSPGVLSRERPGAGRHRVGAVAGWRPSEEPYWRPATRFVLAAAIAVGVCRLLWQVVPRTLAVRTGIVGYPTFANFAYQPAFWAWRLTVYGFPVFMIGAYSVLAWRGPLRRASRPVRRPIRLIDRPDPARSEPDRVGFRPGTVLRLALPTLVVVAAASRDGRYDWRAASAGVAYLLVIIGGALALAWEGGRREGLLRRADPTDRQSFWAKLSLTNGVGSVVAALLGLWYVSAHTWVLAAGVRYPMAWLPLWLVLVGVFGVVGWAVWRLRRGLSTWDAEHRLLVVVGALALFLATSVLPGALTMFRGFDDALELAGATLVGHGLVPWHDFLFMHGLFPDVLRGLISTGAFGHSAWALPAGLRMLFTPASWVFVYLMAAWASKGNPWVLTAVFALAVGPFAPTLETRFVFVPLTLIVLGLALRRRTRAWSAILVLVLLVQAVLVPETSLLAVTALACVVASDLLHHCEPGRGLWAALRMTRRCVVAGVILLAVLAGVLVAFGALRGFVEYYVIVGQDHNLTGAIPPTRIGAVETVQIVTGAVLILLTVWVVTARVRRRGDWQAADWVLVATAAFVALYGEKFLGHFDSQHVWQFATVELSLVALWLWQAGVIVADALSRWPPRPRTARRVTGWSKRSLALAGAATAIVVGVAGVASPANLERQHQVSLADPISPLDRAGFVAGPKVIDDTMVRDLDSVIRTYAGTDQPVFDMTNSPGYVDFLLGRTPATRFDPIVLAIPPHAQWLTIDDLKKSRPPLVLFDSTTMGVPVWDGIANNVRHYIVSEYVLDRYEPIMITHGTLVLLRRDLVKPDMTVPTLRQAPATTDLWYGRTCQWGYSPDFMPRAARGPSLRLPVTPLGQYRIESAWGWAVDPATGQGASSVLVTQGDRVVASFTPTFARLDLPRSATPLGFAFSRGFADQTQPGFYVMSADGTAHPLQASPVPAVPMLHYPDGHLVVTSPLSAGRLEAEGSVVRSVGQIHVPPGTDLGRYPLATVTSSAGSLGDGSYRISNLIGDPQHSIAFDAKPDVGASLGVQVGACLQWHGFSAAGPLYVEQSGGAPVTSVVVSGVRN